MGIKLYVGKVPETDKESQSYTRLYGGLYFVSDVIQLNSHKLEEKLPKDIKDKLKQIYNYLEPGVKNTKKTWSPSEAEEIFVSLKNALNTIKPLNEKESERKTWHLNHINKILEIIRTAKKNNQQIEMTIG